MIFMRNQSFFKKRTYGDYQLEYKLHVPQVYVKWRNHGIWVSLCREKGPERDNLDHTNGKSVLCWRWESLQVSLGQWVTSHSVFALELPPELGCSWAPPSQLGHCSVVGLLRELLTSDMRGAPHTLEPSPCLNHDTSDSVPFSYFVRTSLWEMLNLRNSAFRRLTQLNLVRK